MEFWAKIPTKYHRNSNFLPHKTHNSSCWIQHLPQEQKEIYQRKEKKWRITWTHQAYQHNFSPLQQQKREKRLHLLENYSNHFHQKSELAKTQKRSPLIFVPCEGKTVETLENPLSEKAEATKRRGAGGGEMKMSQPFSSFL